MKLLILSTCLMLVFLNTASALKCWMCMGSMTSDCFRGEEESMVIQDCDETRNEALGRASGQLQMKVADNREEVIVSTCVDFIMMTSGSETFTRGCGWIYESVDICEYMGDIIELHGCESCNSNLCNNNPLLL